MNLRNYPLQEEEFKREIEPHIVAYKNRLGRPSTINYYENLSSQFRKVS